MEFARRYKYKSSKGIFIRILQIIFTICIIWSLIAIVKWFIDNNKTKEIKNKLDKAVNIETDDNYNIDFEILKRYNTDVVAWLKVNNTNIQYPVVQTNDNKYYLNHSFDKTVNSTGWIFADYKNKFDETDKNIIIYGHNRKDQSMFGSLHKVLDKDWYENKENKEIILITEKEKYEYEVFSVYQIPDEEYYIKTNFNSTEEFKNFINELKSRSIYNFNTDINEISQIITLSTCGASNKYRVVLHAKLMQ